MSSLCVSWPRIYNSLTITKSSNHTLSLLRPTSNSSSTAVCRLVLILLTELSSNPSYRLSLYRLCTDPTENTAFTVDEACLPLGCLTINILLLSAMVCCGDMFTGPLPSYESIRHNIYRCNNDHILLLTSSSSYRNCHSFLD
jgi:hypothetical protein